MPDIKDHPLVIKWLNREYWPMFILYIPVCIQHLWLSLKAGNPFFFLTANPAIDEGFILSDSKFRTLQLVPEKQRPITIFADQNEIAENILKRMQEYELNFPVIVKPDIGYRGLHVHLINNEQQFKQLVKNIKVPHIIQEYIDYDVEIGLFYYRFPNCETGCIPSITIKEFLAVIGTGTHTLEELIFKDPRAILQKEKLKKKFPKEWNRVVEKDRQIVLEPIGNHNRGTKFLNGAALMDDKLLAVFDALNHKMKGFYYGRFDIRTKSVDDLKQGKNFKIVEVNGVGAEPTHIYDPAYTVLKGWKELLFLWRIVFKIAHLHKKSGLGYIKWPEGVSRFKSYLTYSSQLKRI
jgi:hypothetical protein